MWCVFGVVLHCVHLHVCICMSTGCRFGCCDIDIPVNPTTGQGGVSAGGMIVNGGDSTTITIIIVVAAIVFFCFITIAAFIITYRHKGK